MSLLVFLGRGGSRSAATSQINCLAIKQGSDKVLSLTSQEFNQKLCIFPWFLPQKGYVFPWVFLKMDTFSRTRVHIYVILIYVSLYIHLYTYLYISIYTYLYLYLSNLSVYLSIYLYTKIIKCNLTRVLNNFLW